MNQFRASGDIDMAVLTAVPLFDNIYVYLQMLPLRVSIGDAMFIS